MGLVSGDFYPMLVRPVSSHIGARLRENAARYPAASFTGIDLNPMRTPSYPNNVELFQHDINLGLETLYGHFDYVRLHFVSLGVR